MKLSQTILSASLIASAYGFVPSSSDTFGKTRPLNSAVIDIKETTTTEDQTEESTSVRVPLKYLGPYPCLSLRFPDLSTPSQRERNVTGISLDFVMDTAANINTLNAQVASELGLEKVGEAPGGMGASGPIDGGDTFLLGDCELEGLPSEDQFTFMTGLTASALPIASAASAGLLSMPFFNCFEGGVEFCWGKAEEGKITMPPSVTFFGQEVGIDPTEGMSRVQIESIPVTLLPSVTVNINGVEMPALLDTGSPITVLNAQAAKVAGVATIDVEQSKQSNNPFANFANNLKAAKAAASGDILQIAGPNGMVNLLKSNDKVDVAVVGDSGPIRFGEGNLFVGDIPGLSALDGLGVDSPPAVVLGMDVLRTKTKMLYRGQQNEVYF